MRATRLNGSATIYSVEADTLGCSRTSYCLYVTGSRTRKKEDDPCPRCHQGLLERRFHQVDIAAFQGIGICGCEAAAFKFRPILDKMNFTQIAEAPHAARQRLRCKHCLAARAAAIMSPENFDALLAAVPVTEHE